ncbi:MAG: 2-amino-4-hydroxy-6-hydroxymethyldihydropteridine diphosphokinase [Kangiellaceae bacterium]|nr:2-amino-4-hydroxy-6-hydroxymethyldihydropteridine diphosphokinase [Kangiellaceae bacterium]
MSEIVYVGLGSNLNAPEKQVSQALTALANLPNTGLVDSSSLYLSKPLGPQDQDDYINAVAKLSTELQPLELLDQLQKIENKQGRIRKEERWGARTLDLDLLLFGNRVIQNERLTVPHYDMRNRCFVLIPLSEISQHIELPDGSQLNTLIAKINQQGIQRL